jgi:hypothetical protein
MPNAPPSRTTHRFPTTHKWPYSNRQPLPDKTHQCLRQTSTPTPQHGGGRLLPHLRREALLRKEVIQPHLPVRLPCYDFVPIASPTFDGSPPHGLGHRLRVLPTFVT